MVDLVTAAAVVLLILGIVGCVVPVMPGAPLSLAGVYLYWWHTGFTEPGTLLLLVLTLLGILAIVADLTADVVSARIGGASITTSLVAGAVGVILLFVGSPVASLIGVVVTVFVLEYRRHRDAARGVRTAAIVVVGMLGSAVVQVLITTSMLVAFAVGVLL